MMSERTHRAWSTILHTGSLSWWTIILNVASALALLGAATWFSYNMFAARDANEAIINRIGPAQPVPYLKGNPQ